MFLLRIIIYFNLLSLIEISLLVEMTCLYQSEAAEKVGCICYIGFFFDFLAPGITPLIKPFFILSHGLKYISYYIVIAYTVSRRVRLLLPRFWQSIHGLQRS
jgi:hypothetical protein